ncbi:hypothetical protein BFM12_08525 [Campylobacter jejuni]|uniref:YopX family protein n=1 Tax=Campylobacter jejuni TaxID=197 RepID=UPI00127CC275|nr:YopX family protein [Campylobacter jejuni]EJB5772402.1 hypothetical protein [Campylobacter coli]EAK2110036.1 hypothetical protein [Campylobacter jejuni]EAL7061381.1 hypothetical protein [Campylobacter jejuni]EHR9968448.1 hypothetical protein [Campylobacter jejuni]NBE34245.1 hypothetical protein [Campylobacter jejuni]
MKLQDFDFRIWDKNYKGCNNENCKCQSKFIYGEEAKVRLSEFKDEDVEIELWTGLYDINGKKIYEGDILKLTKKRESNITKARCYVEYEVGCFVLYGNRYYEGTLDTNLSYQDAEIIGNIHEKEDLLK